MSIQNNITLALCYEAFRPLLHRDATTVSTSLTRSIFTDPTSIQKVIPLNDRQLTDLTRDVTAGSSLCKTLQKIFEALLSVVTFGKFQTSSSRVDESLRIVCAAHLVEASPQTLDFEDGLNIRPPTTGNSQKLDQQLVELHQSYLLAVAQIGGINSTTTSQFRERLSVEHPLVKTKNTKVTAASAKELIPVHNAHVKALTPLESSEALHRLNREVFAKVVTLCNQSGARVVVDGHDLTAQYTTSIQDVIDYLNANRITDLHEILTGKPPEEEDRPPSSPPTGERPKGPLPDPTRPR